MQQIANITAYSMTDRLALGAALLRGQYIIREHLADGGFGQTYLAEDSLGRMVVIKECYPSAICTRDSGQVRPIRREQDRLYQAVVSQFVNEARRLARLSHPHIVRVHQVFEENGTAYMALDHVQGDDLQTLLEDAAETLTPDLVESTLRSALEALDYIHIQGLLHRDIAPDNLMLGPRGEVTIIDFGSAQDQAAAPCEMLAVKDGFSPVEFYDRAGRHTAASDLYSLAATMHLLVTRTSPAPADQRADAIAAGHADPRVALCQGAWGYERKILGSIDRAMSLDPLARPQSAREWLEMLDGLRDPFDVPVQDVMPAAVDPDLERRIATLVRTARQTTREAPQATASKPVQVSDTPAAVSRSPRSRPLVDMFGAPIEDVDAWLREQDRLKSQQPAQTADAQKPPAPPPPAAPPLTTVTSHVPHEPPETPDTVSSRSMFARLLGKRRKPGPAPLTIDRKDQP